MMTLDLRDVHIPLSDIGRYVSRSPQQISRYIAAGLLKKKDRGSATLHDFNKFLARKFPRLPRFDDVEAFDQWNAQGRKPANN